MHQPGEKWMYNTGADVLSVLIARASGQPLETFLRERIFEPLGMKDTGFSVPGDKLDRLATSYWTNFMSGKIEVFDAAKGGQWSRPPAFPSGAGGLVSTIDDYLAFGQMMLNNGKHVSERILSRLSVETMTTDQLTPEQKAVSGLIPGYFDSHGWGFRHVYSHQPRRYSISTRTLRLGRRHGHLMVFRPDRGDGHYPYDPAILDFPQSTECLP